MGAVQVLPDKNMIICIIHFVNVPRILFTSPPPPPTPRSILNNTHRRPCQLSPPYPPRPPPGFPHLADVFHQPHRKYSDSTSLPYLTCLADLTYLTCLHKTTCRNLPLSILPLSQTTTTFKLQTTQSPSTPHPALLPNPELPTLLGRSEGNSGCAV